MESLRQRLHLHSDPAYDVFYMKHFVAPILPLAMLSAAASTWVVWISNLGDGYPHPGRQAAVSVGGGLVMAILAWLCRRWASEGRLHAASFAVVFFGGVMASVACWGAYHRGSDMLGAFPICMILVIIGSLFAPRLWVLLLGFVATLVLPTSVLLDALATSDPADQSVYRSLVMFTFATALTFYLLGNRIKRSYFNLLTDQRNQTLRDSLTGLYNRPGWYEKAEVVHGSHPGTAATVLYIDIDHFKHVNDALGHAEGDRVLQDFARTLSGNLDPDALAARLGGEEFVVLLPTATPEAARALATKIRSAMAGTSGLDESITVSIGIARQQSHETLEHVVLRADHALLRAKRLGRDRIEVAGSAPPPTTLPDVELASFHGDALEPALVPAFAPGPCNGDPGRNDTSSGVQRAP
jgi:diguanylate cyclase (GGDEF)-like protein